MEDYYSIEKIYKYLFYLQNLNEELNHFGVYENFIVCKGINLFYFMQVNNLFYYKNKSLEIKNSKDNI